MSSENSGSQPRPFLSVLGTILKFFIGIFLCIAACGGLYWIIEGPRYMELDLPTEGSVDNWNNIQSIDVIRHPGSQRYYLWKAQETFEDTSVSALADRLDEWFLDHDWVSEEIYYDAALQFQDVDHELCDYSLAELAADKNCRIYYYPAAGIPIGCIPVAEVIVWNGPFMNETNVDVTTLRTSPFTTTFWCGGW
jgi:hypothetical protein